MLPDPSASFTLPSLYDDLELDCRLYFPRTRPKSLDSPQVFQAQGCAIFAHPYAPLGGSFDDHVVHTVGGLLIKEGFLLVTFNFRGAEKSAGRTSWSGKAELADYVSVCAFVLSFMESDGVVQYLNHGTSTQPLLLLGGYSYGSMITANLPNLQVATSILSDAKPGSAEHEIIHRAGELSHAFLGFCETQQERGRTSLKPPPDSMSPGKGGTTFGGYESPSESQKVNRAASRRSVDADKVRQSVDRVRRKISSRTSSGSHPSPGKATAVTEQPRSFVTPRLTYLLVSPLLGPVSSLATVFSSLSFERRDRSATAARGTLVSTPEEKLGTVPSLVIFGSDDHFTSSRKVRSWCEVIRAKPGSQLQFHEVAEIGHFWHDDAASTQLKYVVSAWLKELSS